MFTLINILAHLVVEIFGELQNNFVTLDAIRHKTCPLNNKVFDVPDKGPLACSYMCWRRAGCMSVMYYQGNQTCIGCSAGYSALSQSSETSPLLMTLTKLPSNTVVDLGGMKLGLITRHLPYDEAKTACAPFGSLAKLDTPFKMDAVKAYLNGPTNGHQQTNFWVQCEYDVIDDAWEYADGTPLLAGYWAPGQPESLNAHCCSLWHTYGFALDDYWCSEPYKFICEYHY